MPTSTYVPLATLTLTATDSEIVFSSIPATYRDLIVVTNGTGTVSDNQLLRLNTDTGSNYSFVFARGNGSSPSSSSQTNSFIAFGEIDNAVVCSTIIQIMDYSATDKHKTVLARSNDTTNFVVMTAGRYASLTAITSVTVFPGSGSYNIGSTFSLYGIA